MTSSSGFWSRALSLSYGCDETLEKLKQPQTQTQDQPQQLQQIDQICTISHNQDFQALESPKNEISFKYECEALPNISQQPHPPIIYQDTQNLDNYYNNNNRDSQTNYNYYDPRYEGYQTGGDNTTVRNYYEMSNQYDDSCQRDTTIVENSFNSKFDSQCSSVNLDTYYYDNYQSPPIEYDNNNRNGNLTTTNYLANINDNQVRNHEEQPLNLSSIKANYSQDSLYHQDYLRNYELNISTISTNDTNTSGIVSPKLSEKISVGENSKRTFQKMPKKQSLEYILKRERNNVAVRKSREKAKRRYMELQEKEKYLEDTNAKLESKIKSLTEEVKKMRVLYASMRKSGILP